MGACCGKQAGPDSQIYEQAQRSRLPDTEADRNARAAAAAAVSALMPCAGSLLHGSRLSNYRNEQGQ